MSELLDSLLTQDRRAEVSRTDHAMSVRHYTEMARQAETLAKLRQYEGYGIAPARGCALRSVQLGGADVIVEIEWEIDCPGDLRQAWPVRALINGSMVDVGSLFREDVLEGWIEQMLEAETEDIESASESLGMALNEDQT